MNFVALKKTEVKFAREYWRINASIGLVKIVISSGFLFFISDHVALKVLAFVFFLFALLIIVLWIKLERDWKRILNNLKINEKEE